MPCHINCIGRHSIIYFTSIVYLQSIIETDDFDVMLSSTRFLCETINAFVARVCEINVDDEQLMVKCDLLREKLVMLLDTLKEEETVIQRDEDELLTSLKELANTGMSFRQMER